MIPRVTLDNLFPRASYGEEPIPGIFLAAFLDPCWVCGRITGWVSLTFEAHVCSPICEGLAWSRYVIAAAKADGDPLWVKSE